MFTTSPIVMSFVICIIIIVNLYFISFMHENPNISEEVPVQKFPSPLIQCLLQKQGYILAFHLSFFYYGLIQQKLFYNQKLAFCYCHQNQGLQHKNLSSQDQ